jgi:hypothetical protein
MYSFNSRQSLLLLFAHIPRGRLHRMLHSRLGCTNSIRDDDTGAFCGVLGNVGDRDLRLDMLANQMSRA